MNQFLLVKKGLAALIDRLSHDTLLVTHNGTASLTSQDLRTPLNEPQQPVERLGSELISRTPSPD